MPGFRLGSTWLVCAVLVACTQEHPRRAQQNAPALADAAVSDAALAAADSSAPDAAPGVDAGAAAPDAGTPAAPRCEPSGGGPYALLEGEPLQLTVRCTQSDAEPGSLSVEALPDGAALDAATGELRWTPGLDQAGRHELTLRHAGSGDRATLRIDVVDRLGTEPVDPARYHEEYGLPVIHVTTDPGVNDDAYTPATIVYRGHSYEGAQAKLRGATSKSYPKRSFTLKFTKADKFNEPGFAGGFRDKRKITLTTTFDDNSYVRQRLGYELWNRLDRRHIQVQAYNAVLFLNGSYFGLYTLTDHVNGYLMEDFGHNQDGDLYKARSANANFRATLNGTDTAKARLHEGYSKEEGLPEAGQEGAFDNLDGFVQWVIGDNPSQLAAAAPGNIALDDYIDWWIFVSFLAADDSISKNSYHYRDPGIHGSVWHVVPWDLNHSFGQNWNTERTTPNVTRPEGLYPRQNQLFEKMLAGPLAPRMRQRYTQVLAHEAYTASAIVELCDSIVAEVDKSARRDEQLWGERYRNFGHWNKRTDFTSFEQEAAYVREWIRARHAYLQTLYPTN